MPDISVVIPTWNRAALLQSAIRSALAQTFPPLEVLVCDDGSTDDSEALVRSFGDSRVRWLASARGGRPAIPRNRGIRESRGEWIAFLDNDDEWLPDKLEKQIRMAQVTGGRAVCGNATRLIPDRGEAGDYLVRQERPITFDSLLKVNRVICSSALLHRSLFAQIEGFPEAPELKALEDYALWLRAAVSTDFIFIPEPLLLYRDDAANSIRADDVAEWRQRRVVLEDFIAWGSRAGVGQEHLAKAKKALLRTRAGGIAQGVLAPLRRLKRKIAG